MNLDFSQLLFRAASHKIANNYLFLFFLLGFLFVLWANPLSYKILEQVFENFKISFSGLSQK